MVALSGIGSPFRLVGVESPVVAELVAIPVPGCDDGAGVIASTEQCAGMDAIKIGHSSQIAL